ncbi:integrative conjugative element protein, RAQPRD family [Pseudomonas moraviensis]
MITCFPQRLLTPTVYLMAVLAPATSFGNAVTEEPALLAAMLRELNAIDRLATSPLAVSEQGLRRHHFDYHRLRADVQIVSAGIQQYLSPQRALPRDDVAIQGDYRDQALAEQ